MRWLRDLFLARRRLRELGETHDRLRERFQATKAELTQRAARAEQRARNATDRLAYYREFKNRVEELEQEVDRLRELNGKTNQKYVIAQDAYEQCRKGLTRRF